MLKVVLVGYGDMLSSLMSGCMTSDVCNVVGVLRYDRIKYSKFKLFFKDFFNPSKEISYIKNQNIYDIKAKSVNSEDFKREILRLNPDVILVGSWSEKFKKEIIDLPVIATINAHPSLLPKYRGPNPYYQVIKNHEKLTGLTFHLMDENLDTGGILYQKGLEISDKETGKSLKEKIVAMARVSIIEFLDRLDDDVIIPLSQNENKATYYPQIDDDEIIIDFKNTAYDIEAKIRAFYNFNKCFFYHEGNFFTPNVEGVEILGKTELKAGEIADKNWKEKSLTIACGDGKLIKFSKLRLYGFPGRFLTGFYIKYLVKKGG